MQPQTGRGYPRVVLASLLVVFVSCQGAPGSGRQDLVESTRYEDLLTLHGDWREFQQPAVTDGVPDYTPAAMGWQRQELTRYQARLAGIDPEGWPISQRVDYHVVLRGETLQDIANYYFGSEVTPAELAIHNGMGTTEVVPGQIIYLP